MPACIMPRVRIDPIGALVAAIAIGGVVRVSTVGMQSYWDDEVFTVDLVRESFVDMLRTVPRTEGSPHLYYVVAWCWAQIFGTGEWGLRSFSALIGTATIPIVYLAARTVGSKRGAAIAALLVATNPLLIWYSQEARAYALLAFLSALSFLMFGRALRGEPRSLLWWSLIACLALATHYFAVFIIAPEAAWLLYSLGVHRATLAATGAVAAVCLALVPLAVRQSHHAGGLLDTSLTERVAQVPVQLLVGYGVAALTVGRVALAVMVLLAGFAGWLVIARSHEDVQRGASLAACIGVVALILPIVGAYVGVDFVKTLYFIASVPVLAIAVALGFAATRTGLVAALIAAAIGLSLAGYVAVTPWLQRPDLRGVAAALGAPTVDRAIVLAPTMRVSGYMQKLQALPARGQRVREVDFVALPVKAAGRRPHVPRKLAHPFRTAGFSLWRRIFAERFTIVRYRASSPRRISPAELLRASFHEWPRNLTSVVMQETAAS